MRAPDGRCTATGRGCGCVLVGAGDGVLPEPSPWCVLDGDGLGVRAGAGRLGRWCAGWAAGPWWPSCDGQQQDPAGVDEAGVGEGAAVRLRFAGVEAEQLVPVLAVAEEPGGDVPQVIAWHDAVDPGPGHRSVAAGRGPAAAWPPGRVPQRLRPARHQRACDGGAGGQRCLQGLCGARGGLHDLQ